MTGKGSLYLTPIEEVSAPYLFSLSDWEIRNIFSKWLYEVKVKYNDTDIFVNSDHFVYEHLEALNTEQNNINNSVGYESGSNILHNKDIQFIRESLEGIIEGKVSEVLDEENIGYFQPLNRIKIRFPPVDITIQEPPKLLVVSPRDRIDLIETVLLKTDVTVDEMEELEDVITKQFDLSALILNLGGIATYPSILPPDKSLESFLIVTAHEWLHHYLFFKPLGREYWTDSTMTSINETVASMFGEEIGLKAYRKFPERVHPVLEENSSAMSHDFDFRKELRETRIKVDDMLNQGQVELAELYMDERQIFMDDNGYYIRKLNQAYFAFNGTYADHPASVSPIASQLDQIRNASDSLSDFIDKVSQISTHVEFLDLVDRHE
tara:strand:- start:5234 stop:6370 length:1137 start_codon:yes stop_codon:yes gene_type:complete